MIIAIDGPAAAGKGTLARRLSDAYNLAYLDTGLLYRAVGMETLKQGGDPSISGDAGPVADDLHPDDLKADGLRSDEAAQAASKCSALPEVRAALLEFQRKFAQSPPDGKKGAVLDGRDIGTVVCPDADIKFFITASVEVRAERRLKELQNRGLEVISSRVLQEMKERDERDSKRAISPLRPADDAIQIDTSALDADAVFAKASRIVEDYLASQQTN